MVKLDLPCHIIDLKRSRTDSLQSKKYHRRCKDLPKALFRLCFGRNNFFCKKNQKSQKDLLTQCFYHLHKLRNAAHLTTNFSSKLFRERFVEMKIPSQIKLAKAWLSFFIKGNLQNLKLRSKKKTTFPLIRCKFAVHEKYNQQTLVFLPK